MTVDTETITCPNPTKSRFATREAAEAAALRRQVGVGKILYPYPCDPACGWWHLTSKPAIAATATDIAAVHELAPEQFRQLVILDAQYQAPRSRALALREPSLVHQWATALKVIKRDLTQEMGDHQGHDDDAKEWRRSASQLQHDLGVRHREAVEIIRSLRHAPGTSANHSEAPLRAVAGDAAIQRLIAAHHAEFTAYLAEEYTAIGATIPARIQRHMVEHGIAVPEPP